MHVHDGALVVSGVRVGGICTVDAARRVFKGAVSPLCASSPGLDVVFGEGKFLEGSGVASFEERFVSKSATGRVARVCVSDKPHVFVASVDRPVYPLSSAVARECTFVFGRMPPDMLLAVGARGAGGVEATCQAALDFMRGEGFTRVDGERRRHEELHGLYATGYQLRLGRAAPPPPPMKVYPAPEEHAPAAGDALGPVVGASASARVLAAMVRDALAEDVANPTGAECAMDREMLLCDPRLVWTSVVAQTLFPSSARAASSVGCAPSFARWRAAVEAL
jgi:hypothetical protein